MCRQALLSIALLSLLLVGCAQSPSSPEVGDKEEADKSRYALALSRYAFAILVETTADPDGVAIDLLISYGDPALAFPDDEAELLELFDSLDPETPVVVRDVYGRVHSVTWTKVKIAGGAAGGT